MFRKRLRRIDSHEYRSAALLNLTGNQTFPTPTFIARCYGLGCVSAERCGRVRKPGASLPMRDRIGTISDGAGSECCAPAVKDPEAIMARLPRWWRWGLLYG